MGRIPLRTWIPRARGCSRSASSSGGRPMSGSPSPRRDGAITNSCNSWARAAWRPSARSPCSTPTRRGRASKPLSSSNSNTSAPKTCWSSSSPATANATAARRGSSRTTAAPTGARTVGARAPWSSVSPVPSAAGRCCSPSIAATPEPCWRSSPDAICPSPSAPWPRRLLAVRPPSAGRSPSSSWTDCGARSWSMATATALSR